MASNPTAILDTALRAIDGGGESLFDMLDSLPAAIYITDNDGIVTYFNSACVTLAGRVPLIGHDRWCVTWKIYTTEGEFIPHDQCPMAIAIREKRPIRGVEAVAERPDGSRVNFAPYPTPLFDGEGNLAGAVNMLIDVTDARQQAEYLEDFAGSCRRIAQSSSDQAALDALNLMAAKYDEKALKLRHPGQLRAA